jgi:hypothetical protein
LKHAVHKGHSTLGRIIEMNEIMELLQNKVGLNEEQSRAVVQLLASHLQSRLPESVQGMVMPLLGLQAEGQAADGASAGLGGMLGSLEGMFEKKG